MRDAALANCLALSDSSHCSTSGSISTDQDDTINDVTAPSNRQGLPDSRLEGVCPSTAISSSPPSLDHSLLKKSVRAAVAVDRIVQWLARPAAAAHVHRRRSRALLVGERDGRVVHSHWPEDVGLEVLVERESRHGFDHLAEHVRADAVRPCSARVEQQWCRLELLPTRGDYASAPLVLEAAQILVPKGVAVARGVGEQLSYGDGAASWSQDRRSSAIESLENRPIGQLRQDRVEGLVECQRPTLDELHHRDGHERLRHRREREDRVDGHLASIACGPDTPGSLVEDLSRRGQVGDHARESLRGDVKRVVEHGPHRHSGECTEASFATTCECAHRLTLDPQAPSLLEGDLKK